MRKITKIDSVKLAIGIQAILLDMAKNKQPARYYVPTFEKLVQEQHNVSPKEASRVTEAVINTGILRWELGANCFVL